MRFLAATSVVLVTCQVFASPPTPEVVIANGSEAPVPVSGEVVAVLSDAVKVDDVPDELTDRLDLILDRLESLADQESSAVPVADYLRWRSAATAEDDRLTFLFNRRIAISSVIISSDNDKIVTFLCDEPTPDECFRGLSSASGIGFGSFETVGSTESIVNFPLPVPAQSVWVRCEEAGDGGVCQYHVSIVGRAIE